MIVGTTSDARQQARCLQTGAASCCRGVDEKIERQLANIPNRDCRLQAPASDMKDFEIVTSRQFRGSLPELRIFP